MKGERGYVWGHWHFLPSYSGDCLRGFMRALFLRSWFSLGLVGSADGQTDFSRYLRSFVARARFLVCFLALVCFVPQPAFAFSLSDIVNGSISNPASVFAAATNAGSQTFTNYVLYETYDMLNRWTGGVTSFLYEASGYMDDLSSLPSEVRTIRSTLSTVSQTLNNVSASLRNSSGSIISAAQGTYTNISAIANAMGSLGSNITGQTSTLGSALGTLSSNLTSQTSVLGSALGEIGTIQQGAKSVLDAIGGALGEIGTNQVNAKSVLDAIGGALGEIGLGQSSQTSLLSAIGEAVAVVDNDIVGQTQILGGVLGQIPGILSGGFSSVVDALGNVAITFPDSITAILAPDTTISVDADVAGEAVQAGTLWDAVVGQVDASQIESQMDATVGLLRTSFPFGCIFVLADALTTLGAAPVAPVFEADLPMVVGTYHAEIDLSFFDGVAALLRGGMVVVYVAGLYSATKQWVFNGGGESA